MLIRLIEPRDNLAVAHIIRTVMPEFGASGQGFAIHDGEVDHMYEAFTQPRCSYFVCEDAGRVVGGGGVAPLAGGPVDTCELKKMYFLREARGKGMGQQVLSKCLEAARHHGYRHCYLETFNTMNNAMKLYQKNGFRKIAGPCGSTGHFGCDTFYQLAL
jgi:putative acetyltransferase